MVRISLTARGSPAMKSLHDGVGACHKGAFGAYATIK